MKDGVLYSMGPQKLRNKVRDMLVFDNSLSIEVSRKVTGTGKGIIIITPNRNLLIKCFTKFEFIEVLYAMAQAKLNCDYAGLNRHMSFAPVRQAETKCKFLIDGEAYFKQVYETILEAK